MSICQVHFSRHGTGYGEVYIYVWLGRDILEVNGGVVLVLGLAEVECELVVNSQIIKTTLLDWVSKIMILSVTFLAVVPSDSFSSTETVPTPVVTQSSLSIALTLVTVPSIDRVPKEPLSTSLAVVALRVVFTRLLANSRGGADRVSVTLTVGARGEVPLLLCGRAHGAVGPGPRSSSWDRGGRVLIYVMDRCSVQGSGRSPLVTSSKTIFIAFITPTTGWVVETVGAGVVTSAQVGHHCGVVLLGTLLEVGGPVHALPVWEGG